MTLDCEIGREVEPLSKVVVLRDVVREPVVHEEPVSGIEDEEPSVADGLELSRVRFDEEKAVFGLAPALNGRAIRGRIFSVEAHAVDFDRVVAAGRFDVDSLRVRIPEAFVP